MSGRWNLVQLPCFTLPHTTNLSSRRSTANTFKELNMRRRRRRGGVMRPTMRRKGSLTLLKLSVRTRELLEWVSLEHPLAPHWWESRRGPVSTVWLGRSA